MSAGIAWTMAEELRLRKLYPTTPRLELARIFGRSAKAVSGRAKVLKLRKAIGHHGRFDWSKCAADRILRQTFPHLPSAEIAPVIGCSLFSVNNRAHQLGLEKSAAYVAEKNERRATLLRVVGVAGRYPKGHVPANKGTHRPGFAAGRMAETQFKKGHRAGAAEAKWVPIGTVKANADGYLRRKIADEPEAIAGKGALSTNWEFVHRRVWEDAHGPIPAGYRIWWKDGKHENCALENLELLNGAEHMARTTIQNLPPELKEVIQLTGALKRKIRNREEKLYGKEHVAGSAGPSLRDAGRPNRQREAAGD